MSTQRGRLFALAAAVGACAVAGVYLYRRSVRGAHDDDEHFFSTADTKTSRSARNTSVTKSGDNSPDMRVQTVAGAYASKSESADAARAVSSQQRAIALEFVSALMKEQGIELNEDAAEEVVDGNDSSSVSSDPALEYRFGLEMERMLRDEILEIVAKLEKANAKKESVGGKSEAGARITKRIAKLEAELLSQSKEYLECSNAREELIEEHGALKLSTNMLESDPENMAKQQRIIDSEWARSAATRHEVNPANRPGNFNAITSSYHDAYDDEDEDEMGFDDDGDDEYLDEDNFYGRGDDDDDDDDDEFEDEEDEGEEYEDDDEDLDSDMAKLVRENFEAQLLSHVLSIKETRDSASRSAATSVASVHNNSAGSTRTRREALLAAMEVELDSYGVDGNVAAAADVDGDGNDSGWETESEDA